MNKQNLSITVASIAAIVVFLVGAYFLTNKPKETVFRQELTSFNESDRVKWNKEGNHILIEYSDLQCPACKTYHEFLKNEIEASGSAASEIMKNTAFVYRHYPLPIHGNAQTAALAAEAAQNQGKFFEMIDTLFSEQENWSSEKNPDEFMVRVANDLGLDTDQFKKDLADKIGEQKIADDVASGDAAGVRGTPTFYLDGTKLEFSSFDEFKSRLIEIAQQ